MLRGKSDRIYGAVCTTVCVIFALLCLYPLIYTVGLSLMSETEWMSGGGRTMIFFPKKPVFAAYGKALATGEYLIRALGVSLVRTVVGTAISIVLTSVTAFVLSRKSLPGRKQYMYLVIFTILFSGGLIPSYLTIQGLGLTNTVWSLILPVAVKTWNVLIFKQFFEGIPKDIEEAAAIDGVSDIKMLWHIILPMSKAVFAAIGLFTVIGHWNSWFDARIYITPQHFDKWPLQLYVQIQFENTAISDLSALDFLIQGEGVTATSTKMALTVLSLIPILIIYPFFQKYFTKGVYMGAVKG